MKRFLWLPFCFPLAAVAADLLPDVPVAGAGQTVVINIPQARLFLFEDGEKIAVYPVAAGKHGTQTPLGSYTIRDKRYKPTWYIPKSIQKERKQKGLPDLTFIPPGPDNPLGPVFVRFGPPELALGIHGTNAPASVPGWRSHGCVRMRSENALKFAKKVLSGSPIEVVYQRFALNEDEAGELWLAVYGNPYRMKDKDASAIMEAVNDWSARRGGEVDIERLQKTLKKKTKAACLTCEERKPAVRGKLRSLAWRDGSGDIRPALEPPTPDEIPYVIEDGTPTGDKSVHEGVIDAPTETPLTPLPAPGGEAVGIDVLF